MRRTWTLALKIAVAAVCLAVVFSKISLAEVFRHAVQINPIYIVTPCLLVLVNRVLMAWKWLLLLRARAVATSFTEVLRIIFTSGLVGLLVPLSVGVDAARLIQIRSSTRDLVGSTGTIIADRLIAVILLCTLSALGVILVWSSFIDRQVLVVVLAVSLGLLAAILLLTARWTFDLIARVVRIMPWPRSEDGTVIAGLSGTGRTLEAVHRAIRELLHRPGVFLPVAAVTLLVQIFRIAQVHLLFVGLGLSPAWRYEVAFVPIIILVALLPISPLGLGVKEGAFVYFFSRVGLEPSALVATSLLTHALALLGTLPGIYFVMRSRASTSIEAPEGDAAGGVQDDDLDECGTG